MRSIRIIAGALIREVVRKKDVYVLLVLGMFLLVYLVHMAFFNVESLARYFREAGLGMVFLFTMFVAVPFTAKLMIDEVKEGTMYPLLAKPVSRLQVLLGKYLGAVIVSELTFTLFYALFAVAAVLKGDSLPLALHAQVYGFGVLLFILLDALVMFFSVHLTFSAAVTLSYMLFFLMSWFGPAIKDILSRIPVLGILLFYCMPHFEFFDIRHRLVHEWGLLPFWVVATVAAYAFFYAGTLLAAAHAGFKKRWL